MATYIKNEMQKLQNNKKKYRTIPKTTKQQNVTKQLKQ